MSRVKVLTCMTILLFDWVLTSRRKDDDADTMLSENDLAAVNDLPADWIITGIKPDVNTVVGLSEECQVGSLDQGSYNKSIAMISKGNIISIDLYFSDSTCSTC